MVEYTRINIYGGVALIDYMLGTVQVWAARLIVLFTAITVHEYAHGYVAYKLGDPTAKYSGRLTLNPIAHLDPIGAVCMVLFGFGWAKPVPINPMYFRDRKKGSALTALAGPISNIVLTFVSTVFLALFYVFVYLKFRNPGTYFIRVVFEQLAVVNIGFAIFNLIPFPPLDGSKILGMFIPDDKYYKLLRYEHFGMPILMILSLTGILGRILSLFTTPIYLLWNLAVNGLINILM